MIESKYLSHIKILDNIDLDNEPKHIESNDIEAPQDLLQG